MNHPHCQWDRPSAGGVTVSYLHRSRGVVLGLATNRRSLADLSVPQASHGCRPGSWHKLVPTHVFP